MKAVVLGHALREIPQVPIEVIRAQVQPKPAEKKAEHHHPAANGRRRTVHVHGKCSADRDHQKKAGQNAFLRGGAHNLAISVCLHVFW